ncbi:MAG: S1 RNA-binding domain-containing protein [Planctomycetota bacterium]
MQQDDRSAPDEAERPRGAHTLEIVEGTIEGVYRDDVFVGLGPRKQGVISRHAFENTPKVGDTHSFTLRGREESLWVLNLVEERPLDQWEELEEDSLQTARVLKAAADGFQVKLGPLHAYMPYSESGVRKSSKRAGLVGRAIVVLVLEVDADKQRAIVSRKAVLRMQKEGRDPHSIVPGQTVRGRVTRLEPYGAFIRFGRGREGLCHISNLSVERVAHPSECLRVGEAVEARVLHVRAGGRRIGLGLKQMHEDPWLRVERECWEGQVVEIDVVRAGSFGAVGRLVPGVEGVLPASELLGAPPPRGGPRAGERVTARILDLDPEEKRIAFSLRHASGAPVLPDEAEAAQQFAHFQAELERAAGQERANGPSEKGGGSEEPPVPGAGTRLGDLLRRALDTDVSDGRAEAS